MKKMVRVLVTGSAGFIGTNLCKSLLKDGHKVYGIDNFDSYYSKSWKVKNVASIEPNENFEFNEIDVRSKFLYLLFEKERPEVVVHLAGLAGVRPSVGRPDAYFSVNVGGTINVLELCRKFGTKNFVFGSSSSVYGNAKTPFYENDSCCGEQTSPYAASKMSSELVCKFYSRRYGINSAILRFFTVYGERCRPDMATYKFIDAIHNERPIKIYGSGEQVRDFTYVGDVVNAIKKAMFFKGNDVFNVAGGTPISINDYVKKIEGVIGKKAKVIKTKSFKEDVKQTIASLEKTKKLLGHFPKTSVSEGLAKTYDWYKKWTTLN